VSGAIVIGVRIWSRAGVELVRIRARQQRLRRRLRATLRPLGEAVHREDQVRTQALREQARAIEDQLAELERRASAVSAAAHKAAERERETLQPTRSIPTA
jgi:hypothetical protein